MKDDDVRRQDRLPSDPAQRVVALVERSRPNETRPRLLDPDLEAKLTAAESERAIRLAAREDLFDRVDRAREMVDESADGTISVEFEDEDSIVHHVAVLRGE